MGNDVMVQVSGLKKTFTRRSGEKVFAIDGAELEIQKGEFIVLLGPSGCGKTTLLRAIAGLDDPDAGRIDISGSSVFDSEKGVNVAVEHRNLSMMFQSYALWPHMTAGQNVAYPLIHDRATNWSKAQRRERVNEVLGQVGIGHLIDLSSPGFCRG